jgi:hypothetical protein
MDIPGEAGRRFGDFFALVDGVGGGERPPSTRTEIGGDGKADRLMSLQGREVPDELRAAGRKHGEIALAAKRPFSGIKLLVHAEHIQEGSRV